jgi:hypothetical protein
MWRSGASGGRNTPHRILGGSLAEQTRVDYIQYEVEGHRELLDEAYFKVHDNLDETNVAILAGA